MPDVDWTKIKSEYITTKASCRKLGEKYGISESAVRKVCASEKWVEARNEFCTKVVQKNVKKAAEKATERRTNILSAADALLRKWQEIMPDCSIPDDLRKMAATLKDIADIQMIKSDDDIAEQQARIENLRKNISREDNKREDIRVVIEGENAEDMAT